MREASAHQSLQDDVMKLPSRSKPAQTKADAVGPKPIVNAAARPKSTGDPSDSAIDGALRRVPLPDGLWCRLDATLQTMSGSAADGAI
jgi:hypothetical protein